MDTNKPIATVTGAGGFIGGHLVNRLIKDGYRVIAIDIKPANKWWQTNYSANNWYGMSVVDFCNSHDKLIKKSDVVFHLAADMGGLGYITYNNVKCMRSAVSTSILLDTLEAGQRFFFSSSAVVYPEFLQDEPDVTALSEDMAYPAQPSEGGYGWEKLFSEQLCHWHRVERAVDTRVARFHNIYGTHGSWNDGREKAPAAMCRKVAEYAEGKKIDVEIWGDGLQTRSFTYIDDCIEGILKVTFNEKTITPINVGSSELVTINELARTAGRAAGIEDLPLHYSSSQPQGVRGRNSDNTLAKAVLSWEPTTPLSVGIEKTYSWIYDQVKASRLDYM